MVTLGGDYTFTPTETGVYSFQTNGNMDTKGELLLDGERLASDDDGGVESNFMVSWLMEASKTYTLSADAYDSTDNGTACMLSVEKVTPVALSLGDKEIELTSGSFYSFTPETAGVYRFSSTGDYDTACTLIQAGSAATDHDSGEGDNFRIIADLSAGTICYLYIFADDDDDEGETCTVSITEHTPNEWDELQLMLNAGGEIELTRDYEAAEGDGLLNVPGGVTVALDLKGHTIDGSAISQAAHYVMAIDGALTLADSSVDGDGQIVGKKGYGVVRAYGKFNMTGGAITGSGETVVNVGYTGSFTMTGGAITGGAETISIRDIGSFTLSGAPEIIGRVYLDENLRIIIGGALANTSKISVSMYGSGVFTDGWADEMAGANPANYFVSMDKAYEVSLSDDGEAQLAELDLGDVLEDGDALSLGDNRVTIGGAYTFTPAASGIYIFESTGDFDTNGELCLSAETLMKDDDNGGNNNFRLFWFLEASKTYTLAVGSDGDEDDGETCVVTVNKPDPVEIETGNTSATLTAGSFYSFTPEAGGEYRFYSDDTLDIRGILLRSVLSEG